MSIDAMKQALEALWNCTAKLESQLMRNPVILPTNYKDAVAEGYTAYSKLRAAIEAAEKQEPVAWLDLVKVKNGMAYATTVKITSKQTPLYATPQPAIPEGWQLVPVESTPEMVSAASRTRISATPWPVAVYKAMLAAAPKPENSHE